jgi:hypothetical protein
MCGHKIANQDAIAKARGEPTKGFHNIQPNYNHPKIKAAIANKKAKQSTKESTPPVQRSAPSSSGGELTSLGIRRRGSAQKRSEAPGRSRSKSQRFSTG